MSHRHIGGRFTYRLRSTQGSGLPVGANVWVSGLSLVGGKVFVGWRPMPFTEYSRREALTGMQLLGLVP